MHPTSDDTREIKEAARYLFNNFYIDEEKLKKWKKWLIYVEWYFDLCDSETGQLVNYLVSGGLFEQPYYSFTVLKIIKTAYIQYMKSR
jgi:hypothetical protein